MNRNTITQVINPHFRGGPCCLGSDKRKDGPSSKQEYYQLVRPLHTKPKRRRK